MTKPKKTKQERLDSKDFWLRAIIAKAEHTGKENPRAKLDLIKCMAIKALAK
jgi:hypothetical protein